MFRDPEGLWAVCTKCAFVEVPTAIVIQVFGEAHCCGNCQFQWSSLKKKKEEEKRATRQTIGPALRPGDNAVTSRLLGKF